MPSQQEMTQLLTQVDFISPQLPETGDFNDQSQVNRNRNKNHNGGPAPVDNGDNDMILLKSKFDHAVQVYRFMHEGKAEAGKRLSGEMRKAKFKEIVDLYHNLKLSNGSIGNYLVNDRNIKWTTFIEDECFWKLWDEKEEIIRQDEYLRKSRRTKPRPSNRRTEYDDNSRSRSRSITINVSRVIVIIVYLIPTLHVDKEQVSVVFGYNAPPLSLSSFSFFSIIYDDSIANQSGLRYLTISIC